MMPENQNLKPMPWRLMVFQFVLSIPVLLTIPVVAAGIAAAIVRLLTIIAPSGKFLSVVFWTATVPVGYAIWLVLFLTICAVDVQTRRWYRGLRKVPRVSSSEGILKFYPVISLYFRARFVYSLPMVQVFMAIPGLRWLVLWSYATSARLGPESYVLGMIADPDLTDIGAGAIVGTGATIVAHSLTTNPDDSKVLVTAPVTIGPRAVIGGEAMVALGVTIGADAIVEPMSIVEAFTQIGPGEVWGGNPAVFRRHRFAPCALTRAAADHTMSTVATRSEFLENVRSAVASALNLSLEDVSTTMTSRDHDGWDSLGQMAIASMLYSRMGTDIPTRDCFRLSSISEIVEFLISREPSTTATTAETLPDNSELLPLLDHSVATRLLALSDGKYTASTSLTTVKVVLAATFSAEPLVTTLKLWSRAFGFLVECESAGFDQVPQALLSPTSPFRTNTSGLNVVLVRPEDLLGGGDRSEELLVAIAAFAREMPNALVVSNLPPAVSRELGQDRVQIESLRVRWDQALANINGLQQIDLAGIIEQIGTVAAANAEGDRIGRIPYSTSVYAELGISVARCVRYQRRAPAKVLALDADGILWGKVLGEDGFDGIELSASGSGQHFQRFQQSIRRLKERGVLLAVVSRNELSDVQHVFESHPEMILRSGDIAAWRVNWQPKSQNLKEIAAELNVGLNSFVFVDDDPANQLEVNSHAPEVTVLPVPRDPADYGPMLDRLWCFDAAATTDADTQRTQMMHQEHARKKHQQESMDLESYLVSLELRVEMRPATAADMPRVAQLTQKTNQFNLSLKRRSEAELSNLALDHSIFVVHVTDRFGDYGLVGVCILKCPPQPETNLQIDTLLISCRALGRGIEEAVLYGILEHARSHGRLTLEAGLISGPRNQPVVEFLQRSSFEQADSNRFVRSCRSPVMVPRHIKWTGPSSDDSPGVLQTSASNDRSGIP
jgi:FkbH-like protein